MVQQYIEEVGNLRVEIYDYYKFDYKPEQRFSFDISPKYKLDDKSHIVTNLACQSDCEIKDVEFKDGKVSFTLCRKPTYIKRIMFNETYMCHQTMHEPACEEETLNLVIVSHFVYQKPPEEVEAEQKQEEKKEEKKKVESKKSVAQKAKEAEEAKEAEKKAESDEKKD